VLVCAEHFAAGSQTARTQSGLAVRLVPQDRRASWDSQKRLAFTPPASLSSNNRSRRVSLGLPGGGAKQPSPDDSAVRLPPLTPPGTDTGSSATAAAAAAAAHPRLSDLLSTGSRASHHIAIADLDSNSSLHGSRWNAEQNPGAVNPAVQGAVLLSHSAQQDADRLESSAAVSSQSSLADDVACSGRSQAEAGVRLLQQQQSQKQPVAQTRLLAAAALDDTGQIGPPITRMRPASIPPNPAPARKGSSSKEHAAAVLQTTAEAILVDALLCGWEQHSNDGVSQIARSTVPKHSINVHSNANKDFSIVKCSLNSAAERPSSTVIVCLLLAARILINTLQARLCNLSQCREVNDSMMQQVDSAALVCTIINCVTVFRIYIH